MLGPWVGRTLSGRLCCSQKKQLPTFGDTITLLLVYHACRKLIDWLIEGSTQEVGAEDHVVGGDGEALPRLESDILLTGSLGTDPL